MTALGAIARVLGGEVAGGQVLAPGPAHKPRDRSLSVRLSATAPNGFIVYSHCGDDWTVCADYVRQKLGLPGDDWKRENAPRRPSEGRRQASRPPAQDDDRSAKIAAAVALWRSGDNPRGTVVETYLRSRGLELDDHIADEVLGWHPGVGAMVALFRNIETNNPQAVSRTFLDAEGRRLERRFLGPVGGAAVMLDAFDEVAHGLHIGEGVETCMTAQQRENRRPTWALGSAGAIAAFPVLGGIECLTILAEHDEASAHAVETCAARWHFAGREVLVNRPIGGKDLNDAIKGRDA